MAVNASLQRGAGLEYILMEPASQPSELPLVVGLHGRGSNAEDLAGLAPMLDLGPCRFVFPNAPLPFDVGPWTRGYAWFEIDDGRRAEGIASSRDILRGFLQELSARFATLPSRMALTGFSQGAIMTLDVGLRYAEPLAGLVAMSGYLFEPETMAPLLPSVRDRKVLIIHGTQDELLSVEGARQARLALRQGGLEPEYHEFVMGHEVTPESLAAVGDFLRRVLER